MLTSPPIHTVPLFLELEELLLALLRSLAPEDWQRPTVAGTWTIKDIAAHLLDGQLRGIAVLRDGYFGGDAPVSTDYADLVQFLDTLNANWVKAMQRVSPALLIDLLSISGKTYRAQLEALDPWESAVFAVAWAGQTRSPNWFHVAREYTEQWHHQQQIRQEVGQEAALFADHLYRPYLETSLQAWPHHYRNTSAPVGTTLLITLTGAGAGNWCLQRLADHWDWDSLLPNDPTCHITLDGKIAWRIFSKGITPEAAAASATIQGDATLASPFFQLRAVMG